MGKGRAVLLLLPTAVILYFAIRCLVNGEAVMGRSGSGVGQPIILSGSDAKFVGWLGIAISLLLITICLLVLLRKGGS